MKKALIGCAAMLLMVFAVGSAKADPHGHGGHDGHGGHGHSHGHSPTVVVRSYAPPVSYRSNSWIYTNRVYDPCIHNHYVPVPVNRTGFYVQFGF